MEPPDGAAPSRLAYKESPAGCRKEAKWSQSPVLPWAQRAYETCLSAGSIAMLARSSWYSQLAYA